MAKDYKQDEAKMLLKQLGYEEIQKGKISGLRVKFFRKSDKDSVLLHKPHSKKETKTYAVRLLKLHLEQIGKLK